jgi:hypothetical protein
VKLAVRMRKGRENLVPVKKQTADGVTRTYYVNPNKDQVPIKTPRVPDLPGQQKLFDSDTDGRGGREGYFEMLRQNTERHLVDPLIENLRKLDPELGARVAEKYQDYPFDQDTKELDLTFDYATAYYLRKMKADPEHAKEWRAEYDGKVDRPVRALNRKKRSALALKEGDVVVVNGERTKISGWSKRGFPVVGGKAVFFEEIGFLEEQVA